MNKPPPSSTNQLFSDINTDQTDQYIGQKMRMMRKAAGITQKQLACFSGITFQQIQKYEKGNSRISAYRLLKIAEFLGVSVKAFFPSSGTTDNLRWGNVTKETERTDGALEDLEQKLYSPETQKLIHTYYSIISAEKRKKILELITLMAKNE